MKIVNYALVGCGQHGCRAHVAPGRDVGFNLAGTLDLRPENCHNALQAAHGQIARVYLNLDELLASKHIEAVVIATPDECHPDELLKCVRAGKHVLVEKPLAIDSKGMRKVHKALAIADAEGLVVTSCHPRRFDPPYVMLRKMLPKLMKKYGKVISLSLDFSYHAPVAAWKHSRSLLLDHFPHEIDYLHFLLGHESFTAHMFTDSFDKYSVAGIRRDGVSFVFTGTRKLKADRFPEFVRIRFERAELTLNTKTGVCVVSNHDTGVNHEYQVGCTDYDLRNTAIMKNFHYVITRVRGVENYLTHGDLVVNTASSISLVKKGRYLHEIHRSHE